MTHKYKSKYGINVIHTNKKDKPVSRWFKRSYIWWHAMDNGRAEIDIKDAEQIHKVEDQSYHHQPNNPR
jgi:hypothetical protein